jgi:O-antigen ligase
MESAVNEARPSFYFLSAASYFMTIVDENRLVDSISRVFLIAAGTLSLLVAVLWMASLSGSSVPRPLATPVEFGGFRVIGASHTMILTQALLIALPGGFLSRTAHPIGRLRHLALVLLPVALLLQHRTVWVSMAVGILVLVIRKRSTSRRSIVVLIGAVAALSLTVALVFGVQDNKLTESFERSGDTHTLEWRYEGWVELLAGRDAPQGIDVIIGTPYGLGYERQVMGTQVDLSPHNYYLETYLRQGVIGLSALVVAYALAATALSRSAQPQVSRGLTDPDVLLALVAAQVVFLITYTPSPDLGASAGIIVGAAATSTLATERGQRMALMRDGRSARLAGDRHRGASHPM